MINALFLDPRIWKIDFMSSPFWNPDKFGVKFDLHPNAFSIPGDRNRKDRLIEESNVVVTSEVWEKPMQRALQHLRNLGKKIVLVPREISPAPIHLKLMFNDPRFEVNGQCYFEPDLILAPGQKYAKLWEGKCKDIRIVGYPRYDVWAQDKFKSKDEIRERFGITNKRIIFFPSYPPYHTQLDENGDNIMVDLYQDLQDTLAVLEEYGKTHDQDTQVIVKIHPMAQKCYNKRAGNGKEVAGILEKYYKNPTDYMKVIGDIRDDSSVARELIYLADMVVGYTSMMMLEAILIGKPVLHVKLEQTDNMKDALDFSNELFTVYNKHDMLDALNNKDTQELLIQNSQLVKDFFYKADGQFCERLCSAITDICR